MNGMSFWDAVGYRQLDTAKIVTSGAQAAAIVGVGEIGFAGTLGVAGWIGGSTLGLTQASAWATAYGVGSIGVAGVVSGQLTHGVNNLFEGRAFGHGLGRWQDMALDAVFAIGGTYLVGSLANRITRANRNYFTEFLRQASGSSGIRRQTGGYNEGTPPGGEGLGRLEGREIRVTQKGLEIVQSHLERFKDPQLYGMKYQGHPDENGIMLRRLQAALDEGRKISGADASVYHPEAVLGSPWMKSKAWYEFWGLNYD